MSRPVANAADLRSLELHREVARRLTQHPELLEQAHAKLDLWQAGGTLHPEYAESWRELLRRGVSAVVDALEDLAIAKYVAGREKDYRFLRDAFRHGIIQAELVRERLMRTQMSDEQRARIVERIAYDSRAT